MNRALLAIHGFSGHPEELRFLGDRLAANLEAHLELPLLPGHGTSPEDMATTSEKEWYEAVIASYDQLADQFDEIIVLGNSFGAALALKLAAERPVTAVIGIAIPRPTLFQVLQIQAMIVAARPFTKFWQKPTTGRLATEQIPGYTQLAYERIPLTAMQQLITYQFRHTRPADLARVTAPTLLVVPHDPFVPASAAPYFIRHLGSYTKEILPWDDRYHLVVQGERKEQLAETLVNWLQSRTSI